MPRMKKAAVILSVACIALTVLAGWGWSRINVLEADFSKQVSGINNAIPFCMKVANAYAHGKTEEIVALSRGKSKEEFPDLDAYEDLDLAFDALHFPIDMLGGEGKYLTTVRYRLLSDVPAELTEDIPADAIEVRDGKRYIYQQFTAVYEYDKLKEENMGWSYTGMDFRGKPFDGQGSETKLRGYL